MQQEDRWSAFCAASKRWREHRVCTPEDAPVDAGHFGFEATGEAALLRKEELLRKKCRAERSTGATVADVPVTKFKDWEGTQSDDTDATATDDQLAEKDSGRKSDEVDEHDSSSDAPETQTERSAPGHIEDLRSRSATKYGSRYFENQQPGAHCGLHALNNLCGSPQFVVRDLARACDLVLGELGSESGFWEDRRQHALPNGWYSHSVLAKAFDLLLPPTWKMKSAVARGCDWSGFGNPAVAGCLVNLDSKHWASIAAHEGSVFYPDSLHSPVLIDEEDYVQIITKHHMTFFVVAHDRDYVQ